MMASTRSSYVVTQLLSQPSWTSLFTRSLWPVSGKKLNYTIVPKRHSSSQPKTELEEAQIFRGNVSEFPCTLSKNVQGPEPNYEKIVSGYQVFRHSEPFNFQYNQGVIPQLQIAYETWGELNPDRSNAILIFTGLSASSHARSHSANQQPGWWEEFIGPENAVNTSKYFVICANHIGSCYGSTGPSSKNPLTGKPYGTTFPVLSVQDLVRAQFHLLDFLGIEKLHACVGSSLGGMCSAQAAVLYPERMGRLISISACQYSYPASIATRYLQRRCIMTDPNWNNGFYYGNQLPFHGMKTAREIATISYRSGPEWRQRFGRKMIEGATISLCPTFLIEQYIDHQGERGASMLDPNTLLYISKAMDLFELSNADLARIKVPTLIIGVVTDALFPVWQQRELAHQLVENGTPTTYYELPSLYGHDTFLLDVHGVGTAVKGFLETTMAEKVQRNTISPFPYY
ncbi:uncharacterized protein LOC129591379 [Paramacrobiotus metropolitanus]|uniref:uncharacterized protein LOC129591379 n=1 Tax=Paramacrobiotus metropolitanus TaxID=2943436 RepID=UPI0024460EAB|nr:uncharacterized protein LOC129591379 [Paramacrobiotus metropolitanus]